MHNNTSRVSLPSANALWLLRLLIPLGAHKTFVSESGFSDDALVAALGLEAWQESENIIFNQKSVRLRLRELHQAAEAEAWRPAVPGILAANLAQLQKLVGLSDTDCRILEFAVALHSDRLLDEAADGLGRLSSVKLFYVLSIVLGIAETDVRVALGSHGALVRSGLLFLDGRFEHLRAKLQLFSPKFAETVSASDSDPVSFLRGTVSLATPPLLTMVDFEHVKSAVDVLRRYLLQSMDSGRRGVNIYVHGPSGTGKTQLAKVLARDLGCQLFEVAIEDADGVANEGASRLYSFRAAQSFLANSRALILFDEVEDVFNDGEGLLGRKSTAQTRKAWINRMLEDNAVPTLWLSNTDEGIDAAFMRRFDMVFELKVPPKAQRARIIGAACGDLLSPESVAKIAETEVLAPAVVTRAARVVRTIRDGLSEVAAADAFERLVNSTLRAQGHVALVKRDSDRLPQVYDPAFINADADLVSLSAGLIRAKSGRVCLYGPPGTGKTAYARWLADGMNVPLRAERASDLLSPYLGGTEQRLASAFAAAAQDGALLLIDEVDTFLRERQGVQHGWEASIVNEMLVQMESFGGVFIAATNLMRGLDQAALRRFDIKVKFDYLQPDQALALLQRYCAQLGLGSPEQLDISRVQRLNGLTPGDFGAVHRRHRFLALTSPSALVAALAAECDLKGDIKRAIGFY